MSREENENLKAIPCSWANVVKSPLLDRGAEIYQRNLSQLVTMGSLLSRMTMERLNHLVRQGVPVDWSGFGSNTFFQKCMRNSAYDQNYIDEKKSDVLSDQVLDCLVAATTDLTTDANFPMVSLQCLSQGVNEQGRIMAANFKTNLQEHIINHQRKVVKYQVKQLLSTERQRIPRELKSNDIIDVLTTQICNQLRNLPPPQFQARKLALSLRPELNVNSSIFLIS